MLSPSQQERRNYLMNTERTPSQEEEYQILISHQEEETKVKEPKPIEFKISHCHHPRTERPPEYSLDIEVEDCHIDVSTAHYDHRIGYFAKLAIFNLQPSDIKALGETIITEALKIEMEAETPEK